MSKCLTFINSFIPHNLGGKYSMRSILYRKRIQLPQLALCPPPPPHSRQGCCPHRPPEALQDPHKCRGSSWHTQQHGCHAPLPRNRRRWGLQTQTCCRHSAICSSFQPTRLLLIVISSQTGGETVNRLRVIAVAPRPQATGSRQCVCGSRLGAPPTTPDITDRPWRVRPGVPTHFLEPARLVHARPPCVPRGIAPRGFRSMHTHARP